jgi:translation initiation factor 1
LKKNLFDIEADWDDGWSSDNKAANKNTKPIKTISPEKHRLHCSKEKRRGKNITVIQPFFMPKCEMKRLLADLKKSLGTGGTIKNNTIELQGNVIDLSKKYLIGLGYQFKS